MKGVGFATCFMICCSHSFNIVINVLWNVVMRICYLLPSATYCAK